MKSLALVLTLSVFSVLAIDAQAGPWNRLNQNIKLPTQAVLDHQTIANPAAASATALLSGAAANNGTATTLSPSAQPDVPRNVTITPAGTTANVGAGSAVVSGTNIYGKAITESISISSAQSTASTGSKAFASVSSVVFPATTGSGVTVSVGTGSKLGLLRCLNNAGDLAWSEFGGAFETTRGTMAASATAVESNTFTANGSVDGAHNVDLYYAQNFRCFGN